MYCRRSKFGAPRPVAYGVQAAKANRHNTGWTHRVDSTTRSVGNENKSNKVQKQGHPKPSNLRAASSKKNISKFSFRGLYYCKNGSSEKWFFASQHSK